MASRTISFVSGDTRLKLLTLGLLLANVVAIAGILITLEIGRPRFFGMTVMATLSVLFLDAFVLLSKRREETIRQSLTGSSSFVFFVQDRRFTLSALALSLFVLFVHGRGGLFFLSMSVFFASILFHALWNDVDFTPSSVSRTLLLCMIGSGVLIATQTLSVAYYARTFDTIYHTKLASLIASSGTLDAIVTTRYNNLPVFHTLASVGIRMTELPPRVFTAIFFVLLFPLSIIAGFVIFRNITESVEISLLAAVVLAINPEFISWGTQSHVQSLSFVFMTVFLVLLSKVHKDLRYTALSGIVTAAWIMTHHLSVSMAIALIGVPIVLVLLWVLVRAPEYRSVVQGPSLRYLVLTIAVIVYWGQTGLFREPIAWLTEYSPRASQGIPSSEILIELYSTPEALALASVPFVLSNLHYIFFLSLAGYGLWILIGLDRSWSGQLYPMVILVFLASVLMYVPNPVWIPLQGLATLSRWGIMTLPFILLIPALGLRGLSIDSRKAMRVAVVGLVVVAMIFTSVGAGFSDPSIEDIAGYEKGAQRYMSTENLDAANYIKTYTRDTAVRSSTLLSSYIEFTVWRGFSDEQPTRFDTIVVENGAFTATPGLTVMPYKAFQEKKIKVTLVNPPSEFYESDVTINAPVSDETVSFDLSRDSKVYDNGDTVIAFNPASGDSPDEDVVESE